MVNLAYIRKRNARRIIVAIAIGCAATALVIGAIAMLGQIASPFTVKLSNAGANLTLVTKDEEGSGEGKVYIMADEVPEYCCYSEELLNRVPDIDNLNTGSGFNYDENNKETATRYFKMSFLIENNGSGPADYDLQLKMSNPTNKASNRYDIGSILRVRFYENRNLEKHDYVTYAKGASSSHVDEDGNESWKEQISVPGSGYAEEFLSSKLILKSHVSNLAKGEKIRNTFVIWLEGNDPECVGNEPPVDSALILGVDISAHASENNSN